MDLDTIELLERTYNLLINLYIGFCIIFITTEIYVRITNRCYRPFVWDFMINIANIGFLGMFLFEIYMSFLTESMITFLYIILIIYFLRNLINGVLDSRYLKV